MNNRGGGRGGFVPGRGNANSGRGSQPATDGGAGRGGSGGNFGRGGLNNNNYLGRNDPNFVQGESSGSAGVNNSVAAGNFGGNNRGRGFGIFHHGSGFNGGYQRRNPSTGRGYFNNGGFQPRFQGFNNRGVNRYNGNGGRYYNSNREGAEQPSINQQFFKETVGAVVAAMAAVSQQPAIPAGTEPAAVPDTSGAAPALLPAQVTEAVSQVLLATDQAGVAKKQKKTDKNNCFKCKKPGHYIDDCTAISCDYCESIHHLSAACNLLHAPKPTVITYGIANEGLMFFELPSAGTFRPKVENAKMARVSVEGDPMTIPQIIEKLQLIIPAENFQWEVVQYRDNIYKVKFPSKYEVQRMKNFRSYQVPDMASDLLFDEWSAIDEPLYLLPEVWVLVDGIPSDVRGEYLTLWGLGSLLGKTMEVDMAYTRKNKILRIKIGCVDSSLIPESFVVFIKRGFYRLHFQIEAGDADMDILPEDNTDDGNRGGDGEGDPSKDSTDKATDMELDRNLQQGTGASLPSDSTVHNSSNMEGTTHGAAGEPKFLLKFGSFPSVPLNKFGDTLEDLCLEPTVSVHGLDLPKEVALGRSGSQLTVSDTDLGADQRVVSAAGGGTDQVSGYGVCAVDALSPACELQTAGEGTDQASGCMRSSTHVTHTSDGNRLNADVVQGGSISSDNVVRMSSSDTDQVLVSPRVSLSAAHSPSLSEVIAFGGLTSAEMSGTRSSSRIRNQVDADATVLERAMKQAELRNGSVGSGNKLNLKVSFLSMSDDTIADRASKLGVSLGSSVEEIQQTVNNLKQTEKDRTMHILQKNLDESLHRDDGPATLVMSRVSNLCEDLVDEESLSEVDALMENDVQKDKEKKSRHKKVYDVSNVRRSTRKIIKRN
jgi:hypothetical protein